MEQNNNGNQRSPSTIYEEAMFYFDHLGVQAILPTHGKIPLVVWKPYQQKRQSRDEVKKLFSAKSLEELGATGLGIVLGGESGLVRLDCDDDITFEKIKPLLPAGALVFKSPRGYGIILRHSGKEPVKIVPEGTVEGMPKFGIKAWGGFTVLPRTKGYNWLSDPEKPIITMNVNAWLEMHFNRPKQSTQRQATSSGGEIARLLKDTSEGERSNNITRVVNMMRARGFADVNDIKAVLKPYVEEWPWDKQPMTWEEAEQIIERVFNRYAHEGTKFDKQTKEATPWSRFYNEDFRIKETDLAEIPEQDEDTDYIVDRLVLPLDRANIVMSAYTGEGKTTIALELAIAMAKGISVWRALDVSRKLRVVYIDQEDVGGQIAETANRLYQVYGRPDKQTLWLWSGEAGKSFSINDRSSLDVLMNRLKEVAPDFIFVDGWQWFVGGRINDPEAVNEAIAFWKWVRAQLKCGTWIIHHNKKVGKPQDMPENPLEMSSGCQILMDQARTKLVYMQIKGNEDLGYLYGKIGRPAWNPIKMLLEYESATQCHRLVPEEEAMKLLDAGDFEKIFGMTKSIMNDMELIKELRRLTNWTLEEVAEHFGVTHGAVSQWARGKNAMRKDKREQLKQLIEDTKRKHGIGPKASVPPPKASDEFKQKASEKHQTPPIESEKLPKANRAGHIYNYKDNNKGTAHSIKDKQPPTTGYKGKPGVHCSKCTYRDQAFVGGVGGGQGCVMLVGEGPGDADAKSGGAFSGLTGQRLHKFLEQAGINKGACRFTHVVKCHVPKSKSPTKRAVECCRPLLEAELAEFRPKTVITLGAVAFEAFYPRKLGSYHGQKIEADDYTLIPMYKPDAFDYKPDLLRAMSDDFYGLKSRPMMRQLEGEYQVKDTYKLSSDLCTIDTETEGLELGAKLIGLAVSEVPGEATYLHGDSIFNFVKSNSEINAVFHNAKFDLMALATNGVPIETFNSIDDTMVLAYCMNKRHLALKDLVLQELHLEMQRFADVAVDGSLIDLPVDKVAAYCGSDTDGTLRLFRYLWKNADSRQKRLYTIVEKPLVPILSRMALNGVYVDVKYLEELGKEMDSSLGKLLEEMEAKYHVTREMLQSPKQLSDFLYKKLGLPVLKETETGEPSTDRFALDGLEDRHPAVALINKHRKQQKLKSAFIDSILKLQVDGMVYPTFDQVGTATGRMSSSSPNMQQLPKREDKTIRRAFIAPPGFVVAAFDNSQIELRVLAYESGDPVMNEIFDAGGDIHDETTLRMFGKITEFNRRVAKMMNFGTVYGISARGLMKKINVESKKTGTSVTETDAEKFIQMYFDTYKNVERYIDKLHKFVRENGYVETWMGRRRYIYKVHMPQHRAAALREAQNSPIQGGASDVIKLQMAAVVEVAMPFAQIHDELAFYLPKEHLDKTIAEIKHRMENIDCPFKLKVEVEVGHNLGELQDWQEEQIQ
jgi:uracil-DNA glycosylase family 4